MKKTILGYFLAMALFPVIGCGGGQGSGSLLTPQTPAGSQGSQSHNYIGTQSMDGGSHNGLLFQYGGTWAVTLDDATKYFSYQNIGHEGYEGETLFNVGNLPMPLPPAIPTVGAVAGSGFLNLTASSSGAAPGAAGYAIEIPGEAALVRPGNNTIAPVVSVITNGCPNLKGNVTYQFIALGTPLLYDSNPHGAYGSVQASNSGTVWTFNNLNMHTFGGASLTPPPLPTGNCGYTQLGYAVSIAPSTATNGNTFTTAVSPNGFFVMDQGQGEIANASALSYPGGLSNTGLVGVEQPSTPLNTANIVAGKYLGFEFDGVNLSLGRVGSMPVVFGQTAGSGTVMTGGAFPKDDVTQAAPSNITIDLGQQDSQSNGLYKNVTVTVPDVYGGCIGAPFGGVDAKGNPTCTFPGEAVIGNPGGKFAIFITVNDLSQAVSHYTADAALDFFLYQQ
ncbi:MAG TPA: hypothetical protein VM554_02320 [Acidisarcina sp.]|nr:hypothetical protein [Acidisarcina sp.]